MNFARAQMERLYCELAPALRSYFRRQPALAGAADDLVHDTFVRAWRRADRLGESVSARAYVFGIARHVGLDWLRARREWVELPEQAAAPADESDERLDAMRAAIARLAEPQRETLLLRLQQELSYEEIAEVLGVPVGTVRSRLHHAVQRLQEILHPAPETKNARTALT
ncbi:MAG TPA: sigma-70 family RNA polymerase sigma factor [Opitutaceae bacterium]|nr:sigma-70 family RNA polymerase sigma factor [Opitutaceae bacterium]